MRLYTIGILSDSALILTTLYCFDTSPFMNCLRFDPILLTVKLNSEC